ncbi:hypothetical protein l11_12910 [Neisseria weaveri LMG 5135]|nr:hypothetical protein l11_12910 [Neisseria weaveri LMG 5135]
MLKPEIGTQYIDRFTAAFGRLCVETQEQKELFAKALDSRLRAAVC